MTSRPRIINVVPPDLKQQKATARVGDYQALEQKISQLKSQIALNEALAKKVLEDARIEAQRILDKAHLEATRVETKVHGELDQEKEASAKENSLLRAEAERMMEEAEALAKKSSQEWNRIEGAQNALYQRSAYMADWEKKLKGIEERQTFSQQEIARESQELNQRFQILKTKEDQVEELLQGLTPREHDVAELEAKARDIEARGKASLQEANRKILDLQTREAGLQSRELELKNRERHFQVVEQEILHREKTVVAKESTLREREKNCEIREAQLRARGK